MSTGILCWQWLHRMKVCFCKCGGCGYMQKIMWPNAEISSWHKGFKHVNPLHFGWFSLHLEILPNFLCIWKYFWICQMLFVFSLINSCSQIFISCLLGLQVIGTFLRTRTILLNFWLEHDEGKGRKRFLPTATVPRWQYCLLLPAITLSHHKASKNSPYVSIAMLKLNINKEKEIVPSSTPP